MTAPDPVDPADVADLADLTDLDVGVRSWRASDGAAVALAGIVVAGAWWARPIPVPVLVLVAVAAVALVRRHLVVLAVVLALVASGGARAAIDGATLAGPGHRAGTATLVSDPVLRFGARCADVSVEHERFELCARAGGGRTLGSVRAGARVQAVGPVEPRPPDDTWMLGRHLAGRWDAIAVTKVDDGAPWARAANAVHGVLGRGAEALPPEQRPLFTGFVLGDDRGEDPAVIDDFRASGLSHLLAVSGQNVAFVLVVVRPVLRRFDLAGRVALTAIVLGFFAILTRAEPSVLRATAMVAVATLASTVGRRITPLRALALAVVALVLLDPLLVRSVGFQLSVGASWGIVVLAGRIAERIPGPRALAEVVAVTLAAQAGVAPLLVGVFGSVPVLALPANVLAVPAAGPIMVWGLTGGMAAGLLGGGVATVVHAPTHLLLSWVQGVAATFAGAPVGELRAPHLVVLLVLGIGAVAAARAVPGRRRAIRVGASILAAGTVLAALLLPARDPGPHIGLGAGAELWVAPDGATALVVDGRARLGGVLRALRQRGHRRIDIVVVRTGSASANDLATALAARLGPHRAIAPGPVAGVATEVPDPEVAMRVGDLELTVRRAGERLVVDVRTGGGAGVGSPGARVRRRATARDPPGPRDADDAGDG